MSPFRASVPLTDKWEHFHFSVAEGIGTVTLDRPGKLNALTFEAYADLRDLLAELPHRGDTQGLLIRGSGPGQRPGVLLGRGRQRDHRRHAGHVTGRTARLHPDER